jgi:DNA invertase Pin-like site-specific DNA recombinase
MDMIDNAMNGYIDLILTKEVSRFARNTVDTLFYIRKLKEYNVGVKFLIDNIDTRISNDEFRLTIMASVAQEESRKTSERVKWGQKRRMEAGVVFGRDLLGYHVENGILTINPDEVPVVKAIFHKYTNEGKGTQVIARELLEEGLRPKRIKLWSNTVILRALRNEKYVGDLCQKKTYTPDFITHAKKYNRGVEEKVYIKDHHEPIIDRDLWDRTQAELERRTTSIEQKSKHSNRYWCSGKIDCGECGCKFVSRTKKLKNGTIYKSWRCINSARHGSIKTVLDGNIVGCDNMYIADKTLLYCAGYCIQLIQGNSDDLKDEILREISTTLKKAPDKKADCDKIRADIVKIESKKYKLVDAMLEGLITKEEMEKQKAWYDEEIASLNIKLAEAIDSNKKIDSQIRDMNRYSNAIDEILELDETNEAVYKEVVEKIVIHKGNVVDIWLKNIPFGIKLQIATSGRLEYFRVNIINVSFIDS